MKKMLRYVLVGIVLMGAQLVGDKSVAKDIDMAAARSLGAYYMSVMSGKGVAEADQISLAYLFVNPNCNVPSAYVFNIRGQGFVIVSGSDYCYPILGYSTEGELDTSRIAPAFLEYFGSIASRIGYAQEHGVSLFSDRTKIDKEWNELYAATLMPEPKATNWLMDECWDQGSIYYPTYNKMCPSGPDDYGYTCYAYVGCVATAMAQIMHYWRYPEHGNGYIGGSFVLNAGEPYEVDLGYIDIRLSDYTYDYANMPNACLSYSSSNAQKDACALLCYHCGVAVHMNYGFSGSGTQSSYVAGALNNKFGYDNAEYVRRSNIFSYAPGGETFLYTDDQWITMMHNEIDSNRPIYYSAYSFSGSGRDAGGHAFVADGYKSAQPDKFHFNWGWGGTPNTWSDVRLGDMNASGYNFYFGQAMVRHITPPASALDIDQPTCSRVTRLHAIAQNADSITFTWNAPEDQTYWRVAFGDADDSVMDNYQIIEVDTNQITLTGLELDHTYRIYAAGRCPHECWAHDTLVWGNWSLPITFELHNNESISEADGRVVLMPNPAHDWLEISTRDAVHHVEIYAVDGRMVDQFKVEGMQVRRSLEGYAPGEYVVRVVTEKGMLTRKLIVR